MRRFLLTFNSESKEPDPCVRLSEIVEEHQKDCKICKKFIAYHFKDVLDYVGDRKRT